jgi:hypothetical protein
MLILIFIQADAFTKLSVKGEVKAQCIFICMK